MTTQAERLTQEAQEKLRKIVKDLEVAGLTAKTRLDVTGDGGFHVIFEFEQTPGQPPFDNWVHSDCTEYYWQPSMVNC